MSFFPSLSLSPFYLFVPLSAVVVIGVASAVVVDVEACEKGAHREQWPISKSGNERIAIVLISLLIGFTAPVGPMCSTQGEKTDRQTDRLV